MSRTIAFVLAVAALFALAPAARADVYDDNPAAASRGTGDLWVFARRSSDGAVLERHWTGSAWSGWSSIGGSATSGPAAVAYGPYIDVFVRGPDGAIWETSLVNGAWTAWSSIGGYLTSAPAAVVVRGNNWISVAARGGDNAMHVNTWKPESGWTGWGSIGGNLTSAPAMDSHSDGIIDVFARGIDGAVWQQAYSNGQWWSAWASLGGGIIGAPAAVNKQLHDLDVYVVGAGNAVYQNHWTSVSGWTGWFRLDTTPVGSSPAVVSDNAGEEILFTRNGDNMGFKQWTNPGGWTGWTAFGAIAVPPPPPPPPPGEVNLVAGLRCTPPGGRLRVSISIHKPRGKKRARVQRVVFFTRGQGRQVRVDRKRPFVVRIRINAAAGRTGRVYARVYFRRSKHGKLHHKTVSRRYRVCT